jgi:hypothetical protein
MAWISITESDVTSRLAGAEVAALKTAAIASGQTDPVAEIIEQVTDEVSTLSLRNADKKQDIQAAFSVSC